MSFARNEADADDLVDEAIARVLKADPKLVSEREVHAYVLTAIRNTWFKWSKARARRHDFLADLRNVPGEYASTALQNLIESEDQRRFARVVAAALTRMDPKTKAAIGLYLRPDRGLTFREIARVENVSVSTAHTRVQQALRMLAEALEEMKP